MCNGISRRDGILAALEENLSVPPSRASTNFEHVDSSTTYSPQNTDYSTALKITFVAVAALTLIVVALSLTGGTAVFAPLFKGIGLGIGNILSMIFKSLTACIIICILFVISLIIAFKTNKVKCKDTTVENQQLNTIINHRRFVDQKEIERQYIKESAHIDATKRSLN